MNNRSNLSRAMVHMVHRRGANGLTLIELGFVIIILAVIVAVALTYYNTLSRNKEVTDVVTDVANIRQAVSSWAGGLPLRRQLGRAGPTSDALSAEEELTTWNELSALLPGSLGALAGSDAGNSTTLANVNPWLNSTYTFDVDDTNPYLWTLTITNIPGGLFQQVRSKVASGARFVPPNSTADPAELVISFQVGA